MDPLATYISDHGKKGWRHDNMIEIVPVNNSKKETILRKTHNVIP